MIVAFDGKTNKSVDTNEEYHAHQSIIIKSFDEIHSFNIKINSNENELKVMELRLTRDAAYCQKIVEKTKQSTCKE